MNHFQPWTVRSVTGLWKPQLGGGPSIRNDQLWEELRAERAGLIKLATEWRLAAEADGWQFRPTYPSEPVEHAFRGEHEGFSIQGIARPGGDESLPSASIHIWGPDGLAVMPPLAYDMVSIRRGTRICSFCDAEDVDTFRVGFAGRVCAACLPEARRRIETPGWCE